MNRVKHKASILTLISLLILLTFNSTTAGIALSKESVAYSLSISTLRSEKNGHYLIEIYIKGIPTSTVTFETDFQTLYLTAKSAGVILEGAISGAQIINLAFDFPADANLKNYFRVNTPNKILIRIPKS